MFGYKQSVLTESMKLREPPGDGAANTTPSITSLASSSMLSTAVEQQHLNFYKQRQCKQEEKICAEPNTMCNALVEDIDRLAKAISPNPNEWSMATNNRIESAMKCFPNWERQIKALRMEAREVEVLMIGSGPKGNEVSIYDMKTSCPILTNVLKEPSSRGGASTQQGT